MAGDIPIDPYSLAGDNLDMAAFRIDKIADLSRQMRFTPSETRLAQIVSAEGLLNSIEPAKNYPLEFVIFRITGYHPKSTSDELLAGMALQHDLGLLIEQVSETLDLPAEGLSEPVLTIEQVADRFSVTHKTIQRWRRKGLPARRFVFGDGKRRVGFLLSSVERFFAGHVQQVAKQTNVTEVTTDEQSQMIRHARMLAVQCGCDVNEIARRIGRKLNRSEHTITCILRRHDQLHPDQAILPLTAAAMDEQEVRLARRAWRHGKRLKSIARRLGRPRVMVYRAILNDRVARLSRKNIKFIDDPLYHAPDAGQTIAAMDHAQALPAAVGVEESRIPRDLPPLLKDLYRTPLLTAQQERMLFLKYNYYKHQFVVMRRRLDPAYATVRQLNRMERALSHAADVRNAIVLANLRLVVSVARKHVRLGLNLMELVSEGNLTLMRAVEGFDFHRGFRFSTYATLALMKGFARGVPAMMSRRAVGMDPEQTLAIIADPHQPANERRTLAHEQIRQMLSKLDDRERRVLAAHWGLETGQDNTYEQVARDMGLSRQRIRQIEQTAMEKLRRSAAQNALS